VQPRVLVVDSRNGKVLDPHRQHVHPQVDQNGELCRVTVKQSDRHGADELAEEVDSAHLGVENLEALRVAPRHDNNLRSAEVSAQPTQSFSTDTLLMIEHTFSTHARDATIGSSTEECNVF
jgi:hypothetical protein